MASLSEVRIAIKNTIDAAFASSKKLTAYAMEPGVPFCPAAWPVPIRIVYHADFDGGMTYTIGLTVAVLLTDVGQAQTALDEFLAPSGAKSIVAILEADPSLGGVVDYTRVVAMTTYGARDIGGKQVLTAGFEVEVMA